MTIRPHCLRLLSKPTCDTGSPSNQSPSLYVALVHRGVRLLVNLMPILGIDTSKTILSLFDAASSASGVPLHPITHLIYHFSTSSAPIPHNTLLNQLELSKALLLHVRTRTPGCKHMLARTTESLVFIMYSFSCFVIIQSRSFPARISPCRPSSTV